LESGGGEGQNRRNAVAKQSPYQKGEQNGRTKGFIKVLGLQVQEGKLVKMPKMFAGD